MGVYGYRQFYLGIDPGMRNSLGFALVESPLTVGPRVLNVVELGVINAHRHSPSLLACILYRKVEHLPLSEVFIENFFFFRKSNKDRKASFFTSSKMQHLVGFLAGFFWAHGVPVTLVAPKRWQCRVKERLPDGHCWSALGIVLGELRARGGDWLLDERSLRKAGLETGCLAPLEALLWSKKEEAEK